MKSSPHKHLSPLLGALVLAALSRPCASQEKDPPFEAFLWIDDAFALDQAKVEAIRALGITGIDAEGPTGVALAGRAGLPFYVDHAVPKGFLHVRRAAFEEARDRWRLSPTPGNLKRPVCLRDPEALARAVRDLEKTVEACGSLTPSFLSLTDEPSATRSINPIDWCRDSFCTAALPRFLSERWGSEALARKIWASRWRADGEPDPGNTDEVRRALFHDVGPPETLVQWNDTRAFAEAAFIDAVSHLAEHARRLRPGLKVALLGVSMPSAFGGFDWEQLGPRFEAFEPYDWGAARDLVRASAPQSDLYHTITPREAGLAQVQHELWRYFLRGDRGVILFDATAWTKPDSRPSGAAGLAEIAGELKLFQGAQLGPWRRAAPLRAQVAILHGMASTRLHWLLDTRYDGASWFNRLASYEMLESSEALNREAWAAVVSDLGLSYRFVTPGQVRDGALREDGTVALVLPRAIAMSDAEVAEITAFAATHFVIADCQCGLFDGRLRKRDTPALDDLFGIARPSVKGVDDFVAHEADSRPGAPLMAAEPHVTPKGATPTHAVGTAPLVLVHGRGANRTVYLNMRIGSYVRNRLAQPEAAERLRAMLRALFIAGRVRPRFEVSQLDGGVRWPFAVHARKDGSDFLIAVELAATTGARPIDWTGPIATARPRVRVTLPGTYRVTNVLEPETLGAQNVIETSVSATRPALYRLTP